MTFWSELDSIRTSEWWMKAYNFLEKFPGYELKYGSFLDGMAEHWRLWDSGDEKWLGPEIRRWNPSGKFLFVDVVCHKLYRQ